MTNRVCDKFYLIFIEIFVLCIASASLKHYYLYVLLVCFLCLMEYFIMPQDYSFTKEKIPHKDLDVYIGKKIKFRRSTLGISQDKLGSYLGVTFQQIQKYEKGVNRVSVSMLYSIAKMLNVDLEYFVEGFDAGNILREDGHPIYDTGFSKKKESKETADLLRWYYKIVDPLIKKKILEIVKIFASMHSKKPD